MHDTTRIWIGNDHTNKKRGYYYITAIQFQRENQNMALQGLSTAAVAASVTVGPPALLRTPSSRLCYGGRIPSSRIRIGSVRCKAVGENPQGSLSDTVVYKGVYGPWTVESSDVQEVFKFSSFNFYLHFFYKIVT